jgi:hypothetical protein
LDTNFAKMDRIFHPELEAFKTRVMNTYVHGLSVYQWGTMFRNASDAQIKHVLEHHLDIRDVNAEGIIR